MRIIRGSSMNELYRKACEELYFNAQYTEMSKGRTMHEIQNFALVLSHPRNCLVTLPERKLSLKYAAGELAFYLAQSDKLSFISHYSKFWNKISDDGVHVNSCYGKRLFKETAKGTTQIEYVVAQLLERMSTKKAVAIIYKERDTNPKTLDNPCTMYLHFSIRENKLNLTTHMRSNDVWFGLPYDVFFFTVLQQIVLARVSEKYPEVRLGEYTHMANSFHMYGHDASGVKACAQSSHSRGDMGTVPVLTLLDTPAQARFLLREDLMRNAPDAIPFYDEEIANSPFYSLMLQFLEGAKHA